MIKALIQYLLKSELKGPKFKARENKKKKVIRTIEQQNNLM